MNYLILDDEPLSHQIIETYCQDIPYLKKVGNCYDPAQAIEKLRVEEVDLLFLDIELPRIQGLTLLRGLNPVPQVIVVSAHKEYAIEGFDLDICDYLLKPFSFDRFMRAIQRVQNEMEIKEKSFVLIKEAKENHQVELEKIIHIEACGHYCMVYHQEGSILTQENISSLENRIGEPFLRVHKSHLVNLNKVKTFRADALELEEKTIPVGRSFKAALKPYRK